MNKKIILFDIDRTLINADLIEEMIYKNVSDISGLEKEKIKKIKDEYRANLTGYTVDSLLDYISQKSKTDLTSLKSLLTNDNIYKKYIYDEVSKVLNKLAQGNNLGIFSDGDFDYQNKKILSIRKFFRDDLIFITTGKLRNDFLKKIPDGVTIIDDDKNVIEKLKQLRPDLELIWINRKDEEKMDGIRTIKSLEELI